MCNTFKKLLLRLESLVALPFAQMLESIPNNDFVQTFKFALQLLVQQ